VRLRTTAEQYRRAHELPGWYPALVAVTPRSVWTVGADRADFDRACVELGPGPAVLRDYVKSMKHYWGEAAFIPELGDTKTAWKVACRFRHLLEDDFAGGFVLRRFEEFRSAEVRTWINGACTLIGPHPDTPSDGPPADVDLAPVVPLVTALGLPFVTVDLAPRRRRVAGHRARRRAGQRPASRHHSQRADRRTPRHPLTGTRPPGCHVRFWLPSVSKDRRGGVRGGQPQLRATRRPPRPSLAGLRS
jgi:hypothetical protein